MHHEIINYPEKPNVSLECFILDSGLKLGQSMLRPAVVICPGGGYVYLSPREGEPVAMAYANHGIHAFILRYSVGYEAAGFSPLKEIDWAIGLIRERAQEWNIDPDKILTCGFSAGGHLALASGLLGGNKPNGMILGYPATNIGKDRIVTSFLAGKNAEAGDELPWMNLPLQISKEAPPMFAFSTGDDTLTKSRVLELADIYEEQGLQYEIHIFGKGPHGYSLANTAAADGSSQVLNPHVAKWLNLSVEWIFDTFGHPVHEDVSTSHIMQALQDMGIDLTALVEQKKLDNA